MRTRLVAGSLFVFVAVSAAWAQTPLGTAFTYQGQLNQAGQPYGGTADLIFRLYDASVGGNLLGSQTLNGVGIADGLFTVVLNGSDEFGADAFNGERRWLDITVNGTPLSPRQELTAAPHALFALDADRLDGLDSTAFLQSIPIPLTLSGTSSSWIIKAENATTAAGAASIHGAATGATGNTYGGYFLSASTSGTGVLGVSNAPSGTTYGLRGQSSSPDGRGVYGAAIATNGDAYGVWGRSTSATGRGVFGEATADSGSNYGGYFQSSSTDGRGVTGLASAISGITDGGKFESASTAGTGVYAIATATSGVTHGVTGLNNSTSGDGVHGEAQANSGTTSGVFGTSDSPNGYGVQGKSGSNIGVFGHGTGSSGSNYGVYGQSDSTTGRGVYGVAGATSGLNYGVMGYTASGSGYAIYANGDFGASGTKSFRIDHPDDPANKYLLHYSTESAELLNAYSGTIVLDATGEAVVKLPHYFAKINRDPRYTLTAVGAPMPMLHVAGEIDEAALSAGANAGPAEAAPACSFRIAGGAPGAKVSWRVEAVRNDRWVQQRGAPVEVEKDGLERGTYQHPELYGQPPEMGMNYDAERERRSDDRPSLATAPDTTRQK